MTWALAWYWRQALPYLDLLLGKALAGALPSSATEGKERLAEALLTAQGVCLQVTEYYTDLLEAASALADQHGDEDFDLEGLPDIVPAEIPAMPSKAGSGTASLAMPPQGPLGQGCPKSTAPGARCLSFGGCPGLLLLPLTFATVMYAYSSPWSSRQPHLTSQHGHAGTAPGAAGQGHGGSM